MPLELWMRPVLCVRDLAASLAYYCERLGFEKRWVHGPDNLIIAGIERGEIELILDAGSVLPRPAAPSVLSLTLHRPETLGDLHRELVGRGAKVVTPPFPVIWQADTYQLDVQDLDGNVLVFWGANPG
jgi:hypothetical protein